MQDLEFIKDRNKRATRRAAKLAKRRKQEERNGYAALRVHGRPTVDADNERWRGAAY